MYAYWAIIINYVCIIHIPIIGSRNNIKWHWRRNIVYKWSTWRTTEREVPITGGSNKENPTLQIRSLSQCGSCTVHDGREGQSSQYYPPFRATLLVLLHLGVVRVHSRLYPLDKTNLTARNNHLDVEGTPRQPLPPTLPPLSQLLLLPLDLVLLSAHSKYHPSSPHPTPPIPLHPHILTHLNRWVHQ